MLVTIQVRRGTETQWSEANPILASGEPGWDTTNRFLKVGNGVDHWLELSPVTLTEAQVAEILEILGNLTDIDDERMDVVLNTEDSDFTTSLAALMGSSGNPVGDALAVTIDQGLIPAKAGQAYFDSRLAPPEDDDIPVITVLTASGISGGTTTRPLALASDTSQVDTEGDTHFRYDGAPSAYLSSGFAQVPYVPESPGVDSAFSFVNRVRFVTPYTDTVEISFKPPQTNGNKYRLRINDRWLTVAATNLDGLATAAEHFLHLAFPRPRVREIAWESAARNLFGGARLASGTVPTRPGVAQPFRVAYLGDSFTAGAVEVSRIETWCNMHAEMIGATEFAIFGIGGSGFTAGADYTGRVEGLLDYAPDALVAQGSINDGEDWASGLQTEIADVLHDLRDVPLVILTGVITPPYNKPGTGDLDFDGGNEAARGGALAVGVQFIDPQADAAAGDPWFDPATEMISDHVHPNLAGALDIAAHAFAATGVLSAGSALSRGVSTETTLEASPTSASVGGTVTLTATVSPATPTGTVQFRDGSTILGTEVLVAGSATFDYDADAAGTRHLSAVFTADVTGFQPSTGTLDLPVINGYSLGVNDFTHRWWTSDLVGADGTVVTTIADQAGDDPLVRGAGDDTQFTIQTDTGVKIVRAIADATSGKLFAAGATDVITTVGLVKITKLGRVTMQSNFYNFNRAANGTYVESGTGGNSAPIASINGWVPVAFVGAGAASEIRVGASTAGAGSITGAGVGASFSAGVVIPVSSLDASGTIIEVAELVGYNRHLDSTELGIIFAALAANSPLI